MQKVEHIGIAVKDLAVSIPLFERLFGSSCYKTEAVESEKVNTAFFQKGETKIELLQGLNADSVITRFIEKKGEGIHHIAFEVADIHAGDAAAGGRRLYYFERDAQSRRG